MKTNYIFRFWLDGNAVFEAEGRFYVNCFLDESHVAEGLFTTDQTGFEPVEDMALYAAIQMLLHENSRLELLQIVGKQKSVITVAMLFQGDYEYFALKDIAPGQISDDLCGVLASGVEPGRVSTFEKPYLVTFKDGKVWALK